MAKKQRSVGRSTSKQAKTLSPPAKLTLAWLWNHVPLGWWSVLGTALVLAFTAGIAVGQSDLYEALSAPKVPRIK